MLTLHFAPNSRASRIYWLLKELDLPFELNRMDSVSYTHLTLPTICSV